MKGLILHPLRLNAALDDRLKVMRVPFLKYGSTVFVEPADPADWNAGRAHPNMRRFEDWSEATRKSQALFWTDTGSVVSIPAPYAHGEVRFVKEQYAVFAVGKHDICAYRAHCPNDRFDYAEGNSIQSIKVHHWRPSRAMPEELSRLTITFLNPRPERVQDVTEEDCVNEGAEWCSNPDHGFIDALGFTDIGRVGCPVCGHDPGGFVKNNFKKDWDTIYPRYPWAENGWVWRYDVEIGRVG